MSNSATVVDYSAQIHVHQRLDNVCDADCGPKFILNILKQAVTIFERNVKFSLRGTQTVLAFPTRNYPEK